MADTAADVLSLCRAVRDATTMLHLTPDQQRELLACVTRAEQVATPHPIDRAALGTEVRSIRSILVEIADGPISALMADAAARIVGDGIGRLFS
ncbi:hypothetical protein [Actinoplanes sp. NPDC026623]|uniref:hypothetical protein n=1 Tax=Actinoplanes sp. NPDC026623 TaxID=3155610 RepID=UPI0033CD43E9